MTTINSAAVQETVLGNEEMLAAPGRVMIMYNTFKSVKLVESVVKRVDATARVTPYSTIDRGYLLLDVDEKVDVRNIHKALYQVDCGGRMLNVSSTWRYTTVNRISKTVKDPESPAFGRKYMEVVEQELIKTDDMLSTYSDLPKNAGFLGIQVAKIS